MKQHWPIALLALVTLTINTCVIIIHPVQKIREDEKKYVEGAHREISFPARLKRLIPGNMYFEQQSPLTSSFYGLFARDKLTRTNHRGNPGTRPDPGWDEDLSIFFKRVSFFNLVLLLVIGVNVYFLCLLLNPRRICALAASCLVFFNPRLLFYIQAIGPELLYLALFTAALLMLILFYRRDKLYFLITAGVLFGFCSLTYEFAGFFLILLILVFFHFLGRRPGSRVGASLKLVAILYCCYFAVVLPQKLANYFNHHVFAISLDKWMNIERGVIPAHVAGGNLYRRYLNASPDPLTREKLSEKRVYDYLKQSNIPEVFAKQLEQFVSRQLNNSSLSKGFLEKRWAGTYFPAMNRILTCISIILSWGLLFFGVLGVVRYRFGSVESALMSVFIIYYVLNLFIIGVEPRLMVLVLPFLGIFTAAVFFNGHINPPPGQSSREEIVTGGETPPLP
jgi:hypothetical protein